MDKNIRHASQSTLQRCAALLVAVCVTPFGAALAQQQGGAYGSPRYGESKFPPRASSQEGPLTQQAPSNVPERARGQERKVSSGTGFFVTNQGHIITNAHVVKGCKRVNVRGAVPPIAGDVLAIDETYDLALIRVPTPPPAIAVISAAEYRIDPGDQVTVIGYPLDRGVSGLYDVKQARVMDLNGPRDEPHWIQFTSSAQQGNSGGPLLDAGGNVIGVVTGKTQKILTKPGGKAEVVGESDVAVSLPVLKRFMQTKQVYFRSTHAHARLSSSRIENKASGFIVNIHCDITPGAETSNGQSHEMALPPGYAKPASH